MKSCYLYYAWGKPICDDHNKYKKLKVTELVLVYSALSEKSHFIYKLQSQSISGNSRSLTEDFNVLLHYRGKPTLEIKYLIFYSGKTYMKTNLKQCELYTVSLGFNKYTNEFNYR